MKICFCNTQDNLRKTCAIVCFHITAIGSLGANTEGKSWCVLAFFEFEIGRFQRNYTVQYNF